MSESVGLGATVDAMFGIIADALMKAQGRYYLKCLYDRVAPEDNKRKLFINDKMYLRITEDPESPIEEVTAMLMPQTYANNQYGQNRRGQQNTQANIPQVQYSSKPVMSDRLDTDPPGISPAPQQSVPGLDFINISGKNLF